VYEKWMTEASKPSAEIVELVNKRQQAKLDKDYTLADEYRKQVQAQGWQILDKGNSFELRKI
jgi:cysteinyl-tRNA synthetase